MKTMEVVDDRKRDPTSQLVPGSPKRHEKDPVAHLYRPFEEIKEATGNFDAKYKTGLAMSGITYHGVLRNSDDTYSNVVVKSLHISFSSALHETHVSHSDFKKQVLAMSELEHDNVIKFLGYSYEIFQHLVDFKDERRYLIFEFAPNLSLYQALRDKLVDWKTRLNIALDAARGLTYLHGKNLALADFNSTRVLLFDDFKAKVAELILYHRDADLSIREQLFFDSRPRFHSQCYDYQSGSRDQDFIKSDVYSFGVILMEIVTGRDIQEETLRFTVAPKLGKSKLHTVLDSAVNIDEGADLVAELAALCILTYPVFRPKMSFIVERLEAICAGEISVSRGSKDPICNFHDNLGKEERVVLETIREALADECDWSFNEKKKNVYKDIKMKLCGYVGECDHVIGDLVF